MKEEAELWTAVLNAIEKIISKPSFETWFKNTKGVREGNKWIVLASNEFAKDWLEERYYSMIKDTIHSITNEQSDLSISTAKTVDQEIYPVNKVKKTWSQILSLNIEEKEELLNLLQNHFQFEVSQKESQQVEGAANISQHQNEDDFERIYQLELEVRELRSLIHELSKKVDML